MKIVFVVENYHPHIGGVEVLFKNVCERLAKTNDVTVVTHQLPGTSEEEWINHVRVLRVKVPTFASRYFFTFLSIQKVMKVAKDADIIHTTTYNAALPARLAAIRFKIPCVITVMEVIGNRWSELLEMGWLSAKIHQYLEKKIVNYKFDRFICISEATKKDLLIANPNAVAEVVYPGIDYNHWDPKKYNGKKLRKDFGVEDRFVYLYYGRPGPSKGFNHLLAAVEEIKTECPGSVLIALLSEDQQYRKAYLKCLDYIDFHDLWSDVIILPPTKYEELPNYIAMADCVVIPSLTEGFGFTTVESCTMEKPVVSTRAGSIPEVIYGKYILTEPAYSVGLAYGVRMIYEKNWEESPAKIFSWNDCVNTYKHIYSEVRI